MKCELCHQADATEAIAREGEVDDDEIYVCAACAREARFARQRKSQRTRKCDEEELASPAKMIGEFMNAVHDVFTALEEKAHSKEAPVEHPLKPMPVRRGRGSNECRLMGVLHLEALHILGELEPVMRGVKALGMELNGVSAGGVKNAGHVFRLFYRNDIELARRVEEMILTQEKNARIRIKEEIPRLFSDSMCRALAILKNCRMLSSGEFFDLLSPLRLAAKERMLDGITLAQIDRMMSGIDLSNDDEKLPQDERDRIDSERADEVNRRFEEVMFNDVF